VLLDTNSADNGGVVPIDLPRFLSNRTEGELVPASAPNKIYASVKTQFSVTGTNSSVTEFTVGSVCILTTSIVPAASEAAIVAVHSKTKPELLTI
jgi:hypothetical protein